MIQAEDARIHDLRRAMWEWRMDRAGGRARLVKDIAREHGATDREISRVHLRRPALTRSKARVISRSDAAYSRAMSLTRRARPFTGSTRHAHMARRSS